MLPNSQFPLDRDYSIMPYYKTGNRKIYDQRSKTIENYQKQKDLIAKIITQSSHGLTLIFCQEGPLEQCLDNLNQSKIDLDIESQMK